VHKNGEPGYLTPGSHTIKQRATQLFLSDVNIIRSALPIDRASFYNVGVLAGHAKPTAGKMDRLDLPMRET
jgi:hypothetical protein